MYPISKHFLICTLREFCLLFSFRLSSAPNSNFNSRSACACNSCNRCNPIPFIPQRGPQHASHSMRSARAASRAARVVATRLFDAPCGPASAQLFSPSRYPSSPFSITGSAVKLQLTFLCSQIGDVFILVKRVCTGVLRQIHFKVQPLNAPIS